MTHDELEAIRRLMRQPYQHGFHEATAVFREGVVQLLAYIDELHGVIHDIRQEPGWELGRQEERQDVLELLELLLESWNRHDARPTVVLNAAVRTVASRGPVAPHLAPDDLRKENEALRAALAELLATQDHGTVLRRIEAEEAARRALGHPAGEGVQL